MRVFVLLLAAIAFSQSTFVRAQQVGDSDPDLQVERGQFTFNEEGAEGGPNHSRKPRVPSQSSGVTIGRGYDLSQRKADSIVRDLVFCGVSREVAEAYSAAAGLKGEEAKQFLIANQSKLVEITKVQQKKLFELMYDEMEAEVRRISDKKETTKVFGKVDWEKLDPRIKEALVDLRVRGDYTAASRKNIQKSVVDNNFDALKVALESDKNWRNVPKARFERGLSFVQYMGNTQVIGGTKGIVRLPRDVPGWLSGDVKNLDDIVFDMSKGNGDGGDNTGKNGNDGSTEDEKELEKELSGAVWVGRFPTSVSLNDLDATFRENIINFQTALSNAGASFATHATKRPRERAYMMHWSWRIAKENYDAKSIPEFEGVNIEWWHGDQANSEQAAQEMVEGFGIQNLDTPPSLNSRHIEGLAIDMSVTWTGTLTIQNADGTEVVISSTPRDATNSELIAVAATYGVIHFSPASKDRNHWSTDGK